MARRLNLPDSASVATPDKGGKLFAPSAARNTEPLIAALADRLPKAGTALEIASGTGQHIVAYAAAFPNIIWQPTEVDPARLSSITAYLDNADLPNVQAPISLDATEPHWDISLDSLRPDIVLLSNLLHLISEQEVHTLLSEAAKILSPDGHLFVYGPFSRNGLLASDGDRTFDASLRAQDPEIGYKSDNDIIDFGNQQGLVAQESAEMPANNLLLHWRKPA